MNELGQQTVHYILNQRYIISNILLWIIGIADSLGKTLSSEHSITFKLMFGHLLTKFHFVVRSLPY